MIETMALLRETNGPFDMALSYPQWQGSGRPENLPRGAAAAADICGRFAPLARVPAAGTGEDAGGLNRGTAIIDQFRAAQDILRSHRPERLLTAGGDCAIDVAVIDYLVGRYPDLSVIWVDAHLDANTPATTPSGNFHGMPVAAIMGEAPESLRALLANPLAPSRFHYVSAHVGDDGDWAFQRAHDLQWLTPGTLPDGPIHIHFDLDSLDPAEFPYVAYQDGRLSVEAGLELIRTAARGGSLVGLTITEFAPSDDAEVIAGARILEQLCEAAAVDHKRAQTP